MLRAATAEKDGSLVSLSALRRAFFATALTSVLLGGVGGALARQPISVSAPFEVTSSRAGNYLSAFVADANRDTLAAATYFREVLRKDPNNRELIERAATEVSPSLSAGQLEPLMHTLVDTRLTLKSLLTKVSTYVAVQETARC